MQEWEYLKILYKTCISNQYILNEEIYTALNEGP